MKKWQVEEESIAKGNIKYSFSPKADAKFLKQVVDGLNLTELINTNPSDVEDCDDATLAIIKFGVLAACKARPDHQLFKDFLKVIVRAEGVKRA